MELEYRSADTWVRAADCSLPSTTSRIRRSDRATDNCRPRCCSVGTDFL